MIEECLRDFYRGSGKVFRNWGAKKEKECYNNYFHYLFEAENEIFLAKFVLLSSFHRIQRENIDKYINI